MDVAMGMGMGEDVSIALGMGKGVGVGIPIVMCVQSKSMLRQWKSAKDTTVESAMNS